MHLGRGYSPALRFYGGIFMNYSPYFRNQPQADTAVLLIHGILSSPRHFDFLIPHIPDDYTVSSILLAGHGGSVKDFSKATMTKWQNQVEQAVTELESRHRHILIVGHSLGSLLTLRVLQKHKSIYGVLLLNVPLVPWLKPAMVGRSLRFIFGKVHTDDPMDMHCYRDLGVHLEPYLWKYIPWIPNFIALLCLANCCKPLPAELTIPCHAFLGTNDEVVSIRSKRWLLNNPNISLEILENGVHFGYTPDEQKKIIRSLLLLLSYDRA